MSARPRKRSVTLHGHPTSVSLEDEFWSAFREIAAKRGLSVNALAAKIDDARAMENGLATAIRLHVLRHYRAAARGLHPARDAGRSGGIRNQG